MKKIISIALFLIIVMSALVLSVSAESGAPYSKDYCSCESHDSEKEVCNCCLYCSNFKVGYRSSCVTLDQESQKYYVCCENCDGIWPCDCGCVCCSDHDNYEENNPTEPDDNDYIPEPDEISFFDSILKMLKDAFSNLIQMIMNLFK